VASTVPAATTLDECRQLVEAQRQSGKVYMMMETVVYSREYLFVKELYDKGELGRIQFLRGSHQQDMEGWPGYWEGFPPMHYATLQLVCVATDEPESLPWTVDRKSVERQQVENDEPVIHARGLPEPVRKFTGTIQDAEHLSFIQGGGHGGSHPHLAHNFLMACLGKQPPMPDAATSVNWTMVGICAHQSALKGGERIQIPTF